MLADLSLWSADLTALGDAVRRFDAHTDWFHFDVADGRFAPTLLFFPDLVRQLRPLTRRPFHVHLMVERPEEWVDPFIEAGADRLSVQVETDPAQALEMIRGAGKRAGLALRLESPLESAEPFLDAVDSVLLLGTPAGVKGCGLTPAALHRIRALKAKRPGLLLIADGAIRHETVPQLARAGADVLVPGSLVFGAADPEAALRALRRGSAA